MKKQSKNETDIAKPLSVRKVERSTENHGEGKLLEKTVLV